MNINESKARMNLRPIVELCKGQRFAIEKDGKLKFDLKAIEDSNLNDIRELFGLLINTSFAGRGSTTPGYPNICDEFEGEERLQCRFKFNTSENIPKDKKRFKKEHNKKFTRAHIGQERTPAKTLKFYHFSQSNNNDIEVRQRLLYLCAMMNNKMLDQGYIDAASFEHERQRRAGVLCPKGTESTQDNSLDKLLARAREDFLKNMCTSQQKNLFKQIPTSSLKVLMPLVVLKRENLFNVTHLFNDERITVYDYINETDGWARSNFKNRFGTEFPFLTDEMIALGLSLFKSFLPQNRIDNLKSVIYCSA